MISVTALGIITPVYIKPKREGLTEPKNH